MMALHGLRCACAAPSAKEPARKVPKDMKLRSVSLVITVSCVWRLLRLTLLARVRHQLLLD